ncbi:MAG: helix-hairpin-helix domain-containing protein [Lachnospiraceae bacterium]|nr:helix-hairpin-helix domain-containing protein [Lachnospiraceae bacterium]
MLINILRRMPVCMQKSFLFVPLLAVLCGCAKTDKVITFGTDSAKDAGDYAYISEPDKEPDEGTKFPVDNPETINPEALQDKTPEEEIYVHVCGAVKTAGVYKLSVGSRAADALEAAGGFTEEADEDKINLAAFISDGQQLYFPYIGDAVNISEDLGGLVDINTAGSDLLCTIPGIGKSKAEAIIEYRNNNGRFKKPEDIMKVSGIGQGVYEKIKAHICAN